MRLIVDTGASLLILFADRVRGMFAAYDGALMYGGVGGYEGLDGILGGLSQVMRRVGFDFERGRLQWE